MNGDDDDDNDTFDRHLGQLHLRDGERGSVISFPLVSVKWITNFAYYR